MRSSRESTILVWKVIVLRRAAVLLKESKMELPFPHDI